jgi:glycosyltransferase involved in cell wall biosynthesis
MGGDTRFATPILIFSSIRNNKICSDVFLRFQFFCFFGEMFRVFDGLFTKEAGMASLPSITVVIPTHNDAEYLRDSVSSVLAQNYPGLLDVLIIDDGSAPTAQTVFYTDDPRVRFHWQPCCGVSVARNAGIARARGELVAFLDADDVMLPSRLERQARLLVACPEIGLVGSDITRRTLQGLEESWGIFESFGAEVPCRPVDETAPGDYLFAREFRDSLLSHYPFNTSTITARRSALIETKRFSPDLTCWEDWDFITRLARLWRVGYCRAPLTLYRKRSGSITTTDNPRKFLSKAAMFRKWRNEFQDLTAAQRRILARQEAEAWFTASYEFRKSNRAFALQCGLAGFNTRPSWKAVRVLLGVLLR